MDLRGRASAIVAQLLIKRFGQKSGHRELVTVLGRHRHDASFQLRDRPDGGLDARSGPERISGAVKTGRRPTQCAELHKSAQRARKRAGLTAPRALADIGR